MAEEKQDRHRRGQPITQDAIERLRRIRKQILQDRQGRFFEGSVEMIRQMREERTRELMGASKENQELLNDTALNN